MPTRSNSSKRRALSNNPLATLRATWGDKSLALYLRTKLTNGWSVKQLAGELGVTTSHLHAVMRELNGK